MKVIIEEKNLTNAKRLLSCDDAFMLLFDVNEQVRKALKYGGDLDEHLEVIKEMILESRLLDLYE